jgi:hypothetical protein
MLRFWGGGSGPRKGIGDDSRISTRRIDSRGLTCPKTYELDAIESLTTIASLLGIYLISGWFVGNHLSRIRQVCQEPTPSTANTTARSRADG